VNDLTQSTIAFVQNHSGWAAPIVLGLAFCESFVFVSLIVPATVILFGIGGLIGVSGIDFWSIWLAAVLGAVAGDWLAYDLALRFGDKIVHLWPLSRDPTLLVRGVAFFERWGALAVFVGRFFDPFVPRSQSPPGFAVCRGSNSSLPTSRRRLSGPTAF
jgi:membrane protein DedA with SNARE-associated domain